MFQQNRFISVVFSPETCRLMAIANCWNTLKQPALMRSGTGWQSGGINLPLNSGTLSTGQRRLPEFRPSKRHCLRTVCRRQRQTFTAKPKPDAEIASLLAKRPLAVKTRLASALFARRARHSRVLNLRKSGTTWLTLPARIPSRLIAKSVLKKEDRYRRTGRSLMQEAIDPLSGV